MKVERELSLSLRKRCLQGQGDWLLGGLLSASLNAHPIPLAAGALSLVAGQPTTKSPFVKGGFRGNVKVGRDLSLSLRKRCLQGPRDWLLGGPLSASLNAHPIPLAAGALANTAKACATICGVFYVDRVAL